MDAKKKILVVDDSDLVTEMLASFLADAGFSVVTAANGVECIEKAYAEIPDLIILDVEMPLLTGYQAGRLLKSLRGVKDIPVIMHTGLSEDKDKYWAISSGIDTFVNKDFDNLDKLLVKIHELVDHHPYDLACIEADAKNVNPQHVFEMMGHLYDSLLFQSTIYNLLGNIGKNIDSLQDTIFEILKLLKKVCDLHLAVILTKYNNAASAFIHMPGNLPGNEVDEFLKICLGDFFVFFNDLNLENLKKYHSGDIRAEDDKRKNISNAKINSYTFCKIYGRGGKIIGTLHLGNIMNNYFSDHILVNIKMFAFGTGIILENAMLFSSVTTMRDKIQNVLTKFVPAEIINELVEQQSGESLVKGEKRHVAVLFADIRAFTTITENNSPESVVAFLNNYFNIMVGIIKKHGGTIDKFIGDAILAVFGAPKSYTDNEARAVKAAAEMSSSLHNVKTENIKFPNNQFNIGIGIHNGDVIVGSVGSTEKVDYTVIGDPVNLASRLEGLTKYYRKYIIISETVREKVKELFPLRELDTVKVKGKGEKTVIYAVEPDNAGISEEFLSLYYKGLKLYKIGNFKTAIEYFQKALAVSPDDYITQMYIARNRHYLENPPKNWDGIESFTSK